MSKQKNVLFKFIKISFKAYKPYYVSLTFLSLINAAISIFSAYSVSIIIHFIENGVYKTAVIAGIIVTFIEVLLGLIRKFLLKRNELHKVGMDKAINQLIADKIMSLPFEYLENPYYLELKKNAEMSISNFSTIYGLMNSFATIVSSIQ